MLFTVLLPVVLLLPDASSGLSNGNYYCIVIIRKSIEVSACPPRFCGGYSFFS